MFPAPSKSREQREEKKDYKIGWKKKRKQERRRQESKEREVKTLIMCVTDRC
jgi:hypothetical protein